MMSYLYMYVIGILSLAYATRFHKELMRIDFKGIKTFFLTLIGITAIRVVLFNIFPVEGLGILANINHIQWWQAMLAGFEEAMFTLPAVFAMMYTDNKYLKRIFMGLVAAVFASGHAYQGTYGMLVTFIYMFSIAPKYMKKFGFYTMVVCHILFDLSAWAFVQFSDKLLFNF